MTCFAKARPDDFQFGLAIHLGCMAGEPVEAQNNMAGASVRGARRGSWRCSLRSPRNSLRGHARRALACPNGRKRRNSGKGRSIALRPSIRPRDDVSRSRRTFRPVPPSAVAVRAPAAAHTRSSPSRCRSAPRSVQSCPSRPAHCGPPSPPTGVLLW